VNVGTTGATKGDPQTESACPDFSLVLACYNEENIIDDRIGKIFAVLDGLRFSSEVIFVDDASGDGTRHCIARILSGNPRRDMRKIEHTKNTGRGGAVADGIRAARGRFAGFIDIDLEVGPAYILPCLLALDQGYDVATACRFSKFRAGSIHRYIMSRGYSSLVRRQTGVPLRDTETGFKFFCRGRILPVLEQVRDQGWFWDTEIMVRAYLAGLRIVELPALFVRCTDKKSSVRIWRDSLDYLRKLRQFSRALSEKTVRSGESV
jgi:glycosyltransferase involved in cell wall biosynthesis